MLIVQKGFNGTDEKMEKWFKDVDARFEKVDTKFKWVNAWLGNLESGVEEIKLKFDNVPYGF